MEAGEAHREGYRSRLPTRLWPELSSFTSHQMRPSMKKYSKYAMFWPKQVASSLRNGQKGVIVLIDA